MPPHPHHSDNTSSAATTCAAAPTRHHPEKLKQGCPNPFFRAIPSPEVTEPICRLPLPTLFRSPEAVHLGDPMRLSVRPGSMIFLLRRSDFQGSTSGSPDAPEDRGTLPSLGPYLDARSFQGPGAARPPLVKRRGKLRPVRRPTSPSPFASPRPSKSGFGNLDPIPFRGRGRRSGPPPGRTGRTDRRSLSRSRSTP